MISFDSDAAILRARAQVQGLGPKFNRGLENGLDRLAERYQQQKVRNIGRTATRAIRLSATGRPLWTRTGAWLNGQVIEKTGPFAREVKTIGPASQPITGFPQGYEQKLATLPVSSDGIDRQNAAAPDADVTVTPQAGPLLIQEIKNEMDR